MVWSGSVLTSSLRRRTFPTEVGALGRTGGCREKDVGRQRLREGPVPVSTKGPVRNKPQDRVPTGKSPTQGDLQVVVYGPVS